MQHILSIDQFDRGKIEKIFGFSKALEDQDGSDYRCSLVRMCGKILATLFFEPSTRTRLSFESAFIKLGGQILSVENAFDNSSNAKGETYLDCVKTVSNYVDFIVLRHPETNSALEASKTTNCPIINAGDGAGEHPTQAILDLYTIWKEKGRIDGLKIAILGDTQRARTINSLKNALRHYDVEIFEFDNFTGRHTHKETEEYKAKLLKCDVVYMTRFQVERWHKYDGSTPSNRTDAVLGTNITLNCNCKSIKEDAIVLHPLPRGNEISVDFDNDLRAKYWDQVKNGLVVRQALILALGGYIEL